MKKLIPVLFFIFLVVSCKKDEKTVCWRCEAYTPSINYTEISNYCDKTTEEIIQIEQAGTNTFTTKKCTRY